MKLRSFSAHQFRNFEYIEDIEFVDAPLIAVLAPNATGKTNFLEAVIMMLRGKSFRANMDECVMWEKDNFSVRGQVESEGEEKILSVQYDAPVKKIKIQEQGAPVSPITFFGRFPLVLFLPEDAFLFNYGPSGRRNFLNTSLASSQKYLSNIVQYHRVLRQRNIALKNARSPEDVAAWTSLLVEYARVVWEDRVLFVSYLAEYMPAIYEELFGEKKDIIVTFTTGAPNIDMFGEILADSWVYEKKYRHTLYGPHRDDISVTVDGKSAQTVCSRGQLRGLVIAMKVASHAFIKQRLAQNPLLLFDEVLSELDPLRQNTLLGHLPSSQIIMTCTQLPAEIRRKSDVAIIDVRSFIHHTRVIV